MPKHITPNCNEDARKCVQYINHLAVKAPTLVHKREIAGFRECMPSHCDAFTDKIVDYHRMHVAEFDFVRGRQEFVIKAAAQAESLKHTKDKNAHHKAQETEKLARDDLKLAVKAVKGDLIKADDTCPRSTTTKLPVITPFQVLHEGPAATQHMIRTQEECTAAGRMMGHLKPDESATTGGIDGPPGCYLSKHADDRYHVLFNEVGVTQCDLTNKGKYDCAGTKQCDSMIFKPRTVECNRHNACIQHRFFD